MRQHLRQHHGSGAVEMMNGAVAVETGKGVATEPAVIICMPVLDGVEAADFTMDRNNSDTRLN